MADPIVGLTIQIEARPEQSYLSQDRQSIIREISSVRAVTNYEYETKLNEEKRKILILKSEYLSDFIDGFKKSMRYSNDSSQYIDNRNKKANNPNI